MKRLIILLTANFALAPDVHTVQLPYNVAIESLWYEIDNDMHKFFGGKWMVTGKITFKHTTKECIKLDHLTLTWTGNPIDYVLGTFYKADVDDTFLPIESYVLGDSTWNKAQQTMQFTFKKPYTLEPISTFYVVLTIPNHLEETLKTGGFSISPRSLPRPFRAYALHHPLSLPIDMTKNSLSLAPIKTSATLRHSTIPT